MISMSQKQEIILRHYREGHSKKRIARDLGINVKTVRRYLSAYAGELSSLEGVSGERREALLSSLTEAPKYDSSGRGRRRLTQEIQTKIDAYLAENARKRSRGVHKQLMKKVDIHEALEKAGYCIGYTSVCNYIREREQSGQEAFIRQHYAPGQVCEFDWGQVKLRIAGREHTFQLAVFTTAYGNYRWAKLFDRQETASFQQAHADFFAAVQGVHYELVYDNARVVIRRFVGRREKEPTEGLLRLSTYYQFRFRFCNVRRGNEKGHVERSVEYVRRKVFATRDCFETRREANAYLLKRCRELNERIPSGKDKSAAALLEEERPGLHPCPPVAFECADWGSLRVDKYSTIYLGKNHYSVPERYVGRMVDVKVYPSRLILYYRKEEICRHERHYTPHGWHIRLEHYLGTLARKPGALAGSVALRQADERLQRLHDRFFRDRPKDFIELLHYRREKDVPLEKLEAVLESLDRLTPQDISLDKIRILCERREDAAPGASQPDAIADHARAQLQLLAQLLARHDSLTPKSPVL